MKFKILLALTVLTVSLIGFSAQAQAFWFLGGCSQATNYYGTSCTKPIVTVRLNPRYEYKWYGGKQPAGAAFVTKVKKEKGDNVVGELVIVYKDENGRTHRDKRWIVKPRPPKK